MTFPIQDLPRGVIARVLYFTPPRTLYNSFFCKPLNEVISGDFLLHRMVILVVAENLAKKIPPNDESNAHAITLLNIAKAWIKVFQPRAVKMRRQINIPKYQANVLVELAKSNRVYFNQALQLTRSLSIYDNTRISLLESLFLLMLKEKKLQEAKIIATELDLTMYSDKTYLKIVKEELSQGLIEAAKETAEKIKYPLPRISAYCRIGREDPRMILSAEQLTAQLEDEEEDKAYHKIAKAKAHHAELNPLETAELITGFERKHRTLIAIVKIRAPKNPWLTSQWVLQIQRPFTCCLARIEMNNYFPGDLQPLVDLAGQLPQPEEKTEAYIELAKKNPELLALANSSVVEVYETYEAIGLMLKIADLDPTHDCSSAFERAQSIPQNQWRNATLGEIVEMQIKHKQVNEAMATARAINHTLDQCWAFSKIGKHKPEVLREAKIYTQKTDDICNRASQLCAIVDPAE
jgi:hypothetical protein